MTTLGKTFIRFALDRKVLELGDFRLKSGRRSPYFFNLGALHDGEALMQTGYFYADAIVASGIHFEVLFGPAYKGIPLAHVTAVCLALKYRQNKAVAYNRKEPKGHGEGGSLVGAPLAGRQVLILDDVLTAGTAVREAFTLIGAAGGRPSGVVVCFDRREKGTGGEAAVSGIRQEYSTEVVSIADFHDLLECVGEGERARLQDYFDRYGSEEPGQAASGRAP